MRRTNKNEKKNRIATMISYDALIVSYNHGHTTLFYKLGFQKSSSRFVFSRNVFHVFL